MGRAKKTTSSFSILAWLRDVFSWLLGTGRPVLILAVLLGAFGGGAYFAWLKFKSSILASPEYRIGPDSVEITPLPPWIHHDIRVDVFRDPRLDGALSIMDDDLVDRIKNGFAQHAWVAKVGRVTKQFPAVVRVDLVYRQPVCMVEVPDGLFAVDAEGVVLPSDDFTSVEASRYPRLVGVDRRPSTQFGGRSGDTRVIGAAEIAAALMQVWEVMRLHHIAPLEADPSEAVTSGGGLSRRSEPVFALFTRSGTQIYWGHAPGANVVGEIPAVEKVARLKKHFDTYDSLDDPQGKRPQLDVRTLRRSNEL